MIDEAGNASTWREDTVNVDMLHAGHHRSVDTTTTADPDWQSDAIDVTISAHRHGLRRRPAPRGASTAQPVRLLAPGRPRRSGSTPRASIGSRRWCGTPRATRPTGATSTSRSTSRCRPTHRHPDRLGDRRARSRCRRSDASSGIDEIEYRINGGPLQHGTAGQVVNTLADGTFTVYTRAIDNAGHASLGKTQTLKVDSHAPGQHVGACRRPAGSRPAVLARALRHRRRLGPRQDAVAHRRQRRDPRRRPRPIIDEDGVHTLQTRAVDVAGNASAWRDDTVSIDTTAADQHHRRGSHRLAQDPVHRRVTGDDGAGSGVDQIERKIDGGAVSSDPNVTITGDGEHTLQHPHRRRGRQPVRLARRDHQDRHAPRRRPRSRAAPPPTSGAASRSPAP